MTLDEVKTRVHEIYTMAGDDESAHGREDDLWEDVLRHIAKGGRNGKALAKEALKTKLINFSRWCA